MVIVIKKNATEEQIIEITNRLEDYGFDVHRSDGRQRTILGAIGVQHDFDTRKIKIMDGVADVYRITAPYKLASRSFQREDTQITIKDVVISSEKINMISGPCSIENEDQMFTLAETVAKSGAKILRGGAYKPRTSPYSFQGLGEEGLKLIRKAADEFGLIVITEILQIDQIDALTKYADILQVGARNMQNFALLKEIGKTRTPVMLKRGLSARIEEFLMSAEYVLANGNKEVFLCERGIRTFETMTRNTFDLSAIPVVHEKSHLPIFADPSHATGLRSQVPPMARAAVAAGADGLMIEIHNEPEKALSDGPQALLPDEYLDLMDELRMIAKAIGKEFA
ncbi:MAG: 3-deoxy-7-phosphoheptulonate synthase [Chlorobi bacterium]|nr:3-deoxy-7-phosphoheptulonate synthase [Chlorobiota bacterium]